MKQGKDMLLNQKKYVTTLYGSHHITSSVAKNKKKPIFDLVTLSDSAYTVSVIENGHEIWEQMTETQNSLAKEGRLALRWGVNKKNH
jgi:hypothetical protein